VGDVTRRIGLSLGADICWPICYEAILGRLDLALPIDGDTVRFDVDRVSIEPFDLRKPCGYDVVIDRLTHWLHTSREWIKKSILLDDLYVFNNPWSIQSMEKQTSYCAMMKLGLKIPDTWMVPPKAYEPSEDLQRTLRSYARIFDLGDVGEKLGYPMFMKPYDGGGWRGVSRIDNEAALRAAYEQSGKLVMHLQKAVQDYDLFVRCVGLGPQFTCVNYDPDAPLHDRYRIDRDFLSPEDRSLLEDITMTINGFFGWDFNSCECLRAAGDWHPIDFANPCPDSQVTSLHYHFPWIVNANIRWSVFCAATRKKMRQTLDWAPYHAVLDEGLPYRERIRRYAAIGHERMETDRFREFCDEHLAHLDEVASEFFTSDQARDAIRQKVTAIFPAHEIDDFTQLFFERIQQWRADVA
jgi:hypothetical protein